MKARSTRLTVETLEDRMVLSTVAYGDINHDGLVDMAAITNPTTVTVSLANPDGSYTVSAVLTVPSNRPIQGIYLTNTYVDGNQDIDGNLDVVAGANLYTHTWLGEGDGTFGTRHTDRFNIHKFRGF